LINDVVCDKRVRHVTSKGEIIGLIRQHNESIATQIKSLSRLVKPKRSMHDIACLLLKHIVKIDLMKVRNFVHNSSKLVREVLNNIERVKNTISKNRERGHRSRVHFISY
jgi:hypothetical protein